MCVSAAVVCFISQAPLSSLLHGGGGEVIVKQLMTTLLDAVQTYAAHSISKVEIEINMV